MEKGVEASAKDITKICIVVKIQLKKNGFRARQNGERRRGCGIKKSLSSHSMIHV